MFSSLLEDPWALSGHEISLSASSDKNTLVRVDGKKDLRVVCPINASPWIRTRSNRLPASSFPFHSHGEVFSSFYLPTPCMEKQESDLKTTLGIASQTFSIVQVGTVHRYTTDVSADDSDEAKVNSWINWSIRLFQEISADRDEFSDDFSGIARRSWDLVMKHVTKSGEQEALMSLIVQLATNQKLRNALHSISKDPRKVLERIRENMKIPRIQQLDGACIREYARRPGYNTATKAGPKQELLALNRNENTNTLENRVYVWVLNALGLLARKYIQENKALSSSERVTNVRKFSIDVELMRKSPAIKTIFENGLIHPVQPNYPLQLDNRYKEIYDAYKKIRDNQKVQGDAWEWQRVLWGCSARMIFYSILQKTQMSMYSNSIYVKQESQQGFWLSHCNAPGPFIHEKNQMYYLVDSWELYDSNEWLEAPEIFSGAYEIGSIGCDAFLCRPSAKKILLIWFAYGTSCETVFMRSRLKSCQNAIKNFLSDLEHQNKLFAKVEGLIIASAFRYDNGAPLLISAEDKSPHVSMLLLPSQSNQFIDELTVAVHKVIGNFLA